MAKAKTQAPATEADVFDGATPVETLQNNDFADEEVVEDATPRERFDGEGVSVADRMQQIRDTRARERALRGPAPKRRKVTNYHDAERLRNLVAAGHVHLATPEEIVDWEEAELLPNPSHYATGTTAAGNVAAMQGAIIPPSKAD